MTSDGSIDQTRLPWAAVSDEPRERVLRAVDYEAWALARQAKCGHTEPQHRCRTCQGTLLAAEAFGAGTEHILILPAR